MTRHLSIAVLGLTLAGCGGSPHPAESHLTGYTAKDKLAELSEAWFLSQMTLNHPPNKVQEINPRNASFAVQAINNGELIVLWGAKLDQKGGTAIVAYEKDAATSGGWALLQNGQVKQFSASDFVSAQIGQALNPACRPPVSS